jgi:hypothetical protein
MSPLFGLVAGLVAFGVLAASGLAHIRHPRVLVAIVREHQLVPRPLSTAAAIGLISVELIAGWVGPAALILRASSYADVSRPLLAIVVFVYVLVTFYSLAVVRLRDGVRCGCSSGEQAATVWTVVRASLLTAIAAFGLAAGGPEAAGWTSRPTETTIGVIASVALALIIWNLPDAMPNSRLRLGAR